MNMKLILEELEKIKNAPFAKKTDKQLMSYEFLSELYKQRNNGQQPIALKVYNKTENRKTKLTNQQVAEIRAKYNPHVYGKKKLSKEYGVSTSVIFRIINGLIWKNH